MWETAEIFGGVGSLSNASGLGYCFDIRRSKSMNCHTEQGLKAINDSAYLCKFPTLCFHSHLEKDEGQGLSRKHPGPNIKLLIVSLINWLEGNRNSTSNILIEISTL